MWLPVLGLGLYRGAGVPVGSGEWGGRDTVFISIVWGGAGRGPVRRESGRPRDRGVRVYKLGGCCAFLICCDWSRVVDSQRVFHVRGVLLAEFHSCLGLQRFEVAGDAVLHPFEEVGSGLGTGDSYWLLRVGVCSFLGR